MNTAEIRYFKHDGSQPKADLSNGFCQFADDLTVLLGNVKYHLKPIHHCLIWTLGRMLYGVIKYDHRVIPDATLAEHMGTDRQQVQKARKQLVERNILYIDPETGGVGINRDTSAWQTTERKPTAQNLKRIKSVQLDAPQSVELDAPVNVQLDAPSSVQLDAVDASNQTLSHASNQTQDKYIKEDINNISIPDARASEQQGESLPGKQKTQPGIWLDDSFTFQGIAPEQIGKWKEAYPAVNIHTEIAKAEAWLQANPKNRKSNYQRFLVNWLSRAQDKAPRVNAGQRPARYPDEFSEPML